MGAHEVTPGALQRGQDFILSQRTLNTHDKTSEAFPFQEPIWSACRIPSQTLYRNHYPLSYSQTIHSSALEARTCTLSLSLPPPHLDSVHLAPTENYSYLLAPTTLPARAVMCVLAPNANKKCSQQKPEPREKVWEGRSRSAAGTAGSGEEARTRQRENGPLLRPHWTQTVPLQLLSLSLSLSTLHPSPIPHLPSLTSLSFHLPHQNPLPSSQHPDPADHN